MLALEDLKEYTKQKEMKEFMASAFQVDVETFKPFTILIGYQSVGAWGCDSSNFFLVREKKTGKLFYNYGSHCSCYGFEEQWEPSETELAYLKSDKFYVSTGGYDGDSDGNRQAILGYIKKLKK